MDKFTLLSFSAPADFRLQLENWAKTEKYVLKKEEGGTRIFQKGTGFLVAPMMLEVTELNGQVKLKAYVRMNLFVRFMSLFILPSQMGIGSGGFRAVLPRKIAREAVNRLLIALGQAPIN